VSITISSSPPPPFPPLPLATPALILSLSLSLSLALSLSLFRSRRHHLSRSRSACDSHYLAPPSLNVMARHDASVHQIKSPRTLSLSLSLSLSPSVCLSLSLSLPHIPRHPHCVTSPHPPVTPERRVPLPASSAFSLSSVPLVPSPPIPLAPFTKIESVHPAGNSRRESGRSNFRPIRTRTNQPPIGSPRGISACMELRGNFSGKTSEFDLDKLCPGTPAAVKLLSTKRDVSRLLRNAEACILRHRSDIQAPTASSAPRRSCECTRCTTVADARNPRRGLGPGRARPKSLR